MAQESWKMDQDETECQRPELSVLCLNNCGFLGTPATMNLCNKCYRDVLHKKAIAFPSTTTPPTAIGETSSTLAPSENNLGPVEKEKEKEKETITTSSTTATIADQAKVVPPRPSVSLNRCFCCRRRVGLSGFRCRCGDIFCSSHRYSDKHECSYDYKRAGREAIAKANPVVKAEKIRKI